MKKKRGKRVWGSYLDFPSFHQRAVKLLSGSLCISARLKCYKTKALKASEQMREKSPNETEAQRHFVVRTNKRNNNKKKILCDFHLGPPLVENDLHVQDFSKLLKG